MTQGSGRQVQRLSYEVCGNSETEAPARDARDRKESKKNKRRKKKKAARKLISGVRRRKWEEKKEMTCRTVFPFQRTTNGRELKALTQSGAVRKIYNGFLSVHLQSDCLCESYGTLPKY